MFQKILIANRGEIACRVIRTLKKLGIHSLAVYSDPDTHAQHVKQADSAVALGGSSARESYLNAARILEIAKAEQVDAIHPGYGFLSENAEFAAACVAANIHFIGPPADAILAMGSKSHAKQLMEKAGVPLLPGYHGNEQSEAELLKQAKHIGFPVLIKPAAGGGGKGMHIVHSAKEFSEKLQSAQREAKSSFGDDTLLLEKYLQGPRHIEIQVFADQHGNCIHCFERDCSTQRRHQKIIEEAPASHFSESLRNRMGAAAVQCAKAIGYVGAGTVEFLVTGDDFYFMEMNTRLQVEHPVTEEIIGVDLVEWQIAVAANLPLPRTQQEMTQRGHAIEARVYAEDPVQHFLPSIGTLHHAQFPNCPHVRVDSGITSGDQISQYYDPMIAKIIAWGETREKAINRLLQALAATHITGVTTNIDFVRKILCLPEFTDPGLSTDFIDNHLKTLVARPPMTDLAWAYAGLYTVLRLLEAQDNTDPWQATSSWRMNADSEYVLTLAVHEDLKTLKITRENDGYCIKTDTNSVLLNGELKSARYTVFHPDHQITFTALQHNTTTTLFGMSHALVFAVHDASSSYLHSEQEGGRLQAPMPGTVVAVMVEAGASVERGSRLMIIEAMKMEHTIHAPSNGIVTEIFYRTGDAVTEGCQLLSFQSEQVSLEH